MGSLLSSFRTQHMVIWNNITKNSIPEGIISVRLEISSELKIGYLPNSLKILVFSDNYKFDILPKVIPQNVEVIHLGTGFNMDITENVLPKKLKELAISGSFTASIVYPEFIERIILLGETKSKIIDNLPTTIKYLQIEKLCIETTNLPMSIMYIYLKFYDRKILNLISKRPIRCIVMDYDGVRLLD